MTEELSKDDLLKLLNSRVIAETIKGIFYFFGSMVRHPAGLAAFFTLVGLAYGNVTNWGMPSEEEVKNIEKLKGMSIDDYIQWVESNPNLSDDQKNFLKFYAYRHTY